MLLLLFYLRNRNDLLQCENAMLRRRAINTSCNLFNSITALDNASDVALSPTKFIMLVPPSPDLTAAYAKFFI